MLLGLAGLRRPAAAGEITASGAGLSLDIGVNGQVGGCCGAGPGAAEGARIERNLGGLAGAGASRPAASGVVLVGETLPGQSGFVWLVIAVRRPSVSRSCKP